MSYHNISFKARLSGFVLVSVLLISPVIASADTLGDISTKLAEVSASLNKIMSSLSSLSGGQQAQVAGTSGGLSLAVTSPNGGETLTVGSTYPITWNSSSVIDKVSIGYSTGPGSLNWIANNIPNTNSYSWNVNVGNTTNTQFKIQVIGYQTGVGSVTDTSDNYFTVSSTLSVTTPPPPPPSTTVVDPQQSTNTSNNSNFTITNLAPRATGAIATVGIDYPGVIGFVTTTSIIGTMSAGQVSFSIQGLPPGITPDLYITQLGYSNQGYVSFRGVPTQAGSFTVTVTFTDNNTFNVSKSFSLNVSPGSTPTPAPTPPTLYQTDLEIFKGCFGKAVASGDSCAKADFDANSFINVADLASLKSAIKYDMTGDSIIDLRDAADNADLNFIKSCFYQNIVSATACAKADFNGDTYVNVADLASFKSTIKYDLNVDSKVDLRDGVTISPTPSSSDVTVQTVTSNRTANSGLTNIDAINFTVDVKNNNGDITTPFTTAVTVSPDEQYPSGFRASVVVQGIRSGETKNIFINGSYLMPSGKDFKGTVTINIDELNNIIESNENNNILQKYMIIPAIGYATLPTAPVIPSVSLLATPAVAPYNSSATLTWFSANTTSCKADGGWKGERNTSGSETLTNLTATTVYFLTCTGPGGSKTQQTMVIIQNQEVVPPPTTVPLILQQSLPQVPAPQPIVERNLYRGLRGDGVTKLQVLLAKDPQIYPSGQVTGYYGFLTEAAVQNFQCKYGIVCSGDPETTGYGIVGPKTMDKISEVAASASGSGTGDSGTATTPLGTTETVANLQAQVKTLLDQLNVLQAKLNALPH